MKPVKNAISTEFELYQKFVDKLKETYRGNQYNAEAQILHICISDKGLQQQFYRTFTEGRFCQQLKEMIRTEIGVEFKDVRIHLDNNGGSGNYTMMEDGLGFSITQAAGVKVYISVISGDSTMKHTFSPDDFKKMPSGRCNIGRGASHVSEEGYWTNQIALDNADMTISRKHAYIKYSDEKGFQLYVEHGGRCLTTRKRVEDKDFQLTATEVPCTLLDGDLIVLGRKRTVMLQFTIKEEE